MRPDALGHKMLVLAQGIERTLGLRVPRQSVSGGITEDQGVSIELGFMTQQSQGVS
jgi:hypothetical protein